MRSCILRLVDPPRFKSLGCRATWSPWLLVSQAIASVTFRLRAATAAAPVHHTFRHPCFSWRKLRLRGCRRCLRLLILSGRSPFGSFYLLGIALRPRLLLTKLARWRGGSEAWLPFSFFLFLWGRHHSEDTEKGAGMGLPVGLFLFQFEGLPCLHTGGSGQWMQNLAGMSVLRDGYLVPF